MTTFYGAQGPLAWEDERLEFTLCSANPGREGGKRRPASTIDASCLSRPSVRTVISSRLFRPPSSLLPHTPKLDVAIGTEYTSFVLDSLFSCGLVLQKKGWLPPLSPSPPNPQQVLQPRIVTRPLTSGVAPNKFLNLLLWGRGVLISDPLSTLFHILSYSHGV